MEEIKEKHWNATVHHIDNSSRVTQRMSRQTDTGYLAGRKHLRLVPGVDFELRRYHINHGGMLRCEHMAQWPCIQNLLYEAGYELELSSEHPWELDYRAWRREGQ